LGVEVSAKRCCGSALNWRENATEKLRKCAEKEMNFDKKQLKSEKFRRKVMKSGVVLVKSVKKK